MVKFFHRTVWAVRDLRGLWSSLWPLSSPCPCTTVLIVKKHFQCVSIFSQAPTMHGWEQPRSLPSSNPHRYPEDSSCQGPRSRGGSVSTEKPFSQLPFMLQYTVGSFWLCCLPGPQDIPCRASILFLDYIFAKGSFFPGAELCICPRWIS